MRMDRFLQGEGLEPTSMCLLRGLSQRFRHRPLRQNMILHLAGLQSHQRRMVPTPWRAPRLGTTSLSRAQIEHG